MPSVSSLIFVVILAVWAVYLVQHWVRRRDHLATARSVDRFSEAMRVLERRRALPRPETGEVTPRAYDTSPLRPARPEVVVKRSGAAVVHGARAVAPPPGVRRAQLANRLRGAALLVSSVVLVAASGLAMVGALPRWSALAAVAFLGLTVTVVRWSAAQERAARRRPVRSSRPTGAGAPSAGRRDPRRTSTPRHPDRPVERPAGRAGDHALAAQSLAVTTRPASRRAGARRSVLEADRRPAPELYDVAAVEAGVRRRESRDAPQDGPQDRSVPAARPEERTTARDGADGGTWDPVPVPPPTYSLKAKAPRGAVAGSSQLPADGTVMALDEEFEDLPHVDRVG